MDSVHPLEPVVSGYEEEYKPLKFDYPPAPSVAGTACLLAGIAMAFTNFPAQPTSTTMATVAANAVGIGFLGSVFFDIQRGIRNLLRTDLMCLISIYGLTLAEFLFPQQEFDGMTTPEETKIALRVVLLGIAAMVIGRHLIQPQPLRSKWLKLEDISSDALFKFILALALLGYLSKLISVQFNIFEMVDAMMKPRFSQPWSRGAIGGWGSLLNELGLLTNAIPPLAGVVWNRRHSFSTFQLLVVLAIFFLTIFSAFCSGTRSALVAYFSAFLVGYFLTLKKNTIWNTIIPIIVSLLIITNASQHMLAFRNMGLRNYIENEVYKTGVATETLAVDYNLASIGWVASAMPEKYDFLGTEMLVWSLVRPVPRALWPGKPLGLSVSVEEIAGAEGWTVAVTYLGEAYMMAGLFGVIATSAFLGALAAWWNRMMMAEQSDYALVVYALGFLASGIAMRSVIWLTTLILPIIALIVFRKFGPFK